jgi:hypothetical protein
MLRYKLVWLESGIAMQLLVSLCCGILKAFVYCFRSSRSVSDGHSMIFFCKERHKRSKIVFKLLVDLFLRTGGKCPAFGVVSSVVLL